MSSCSRRDPHALGDCPDYSDEALVQAILATPRRIQMTTPHGLEPLELTEAEVRDIVAHGKGPKLLELARKES